MIWIWKFGVHSMKDSSEKAMEVNDELRLNVDELQDDKKNAKRNRT